MFRTCQRPHHIESTSSRPITEVKQCRAWLVLGRVTAWEHRVLLAFVINILPLLFFHSHSISEDYKKYDENLIAQDPISISPSLLRAKFPIWRLALVSIRSGFFFIRIPTSSKPRSTSSIFIFPQFHLHIKIFHSSSFAPRDCLTFTL